MHKIFFILGLKLSCIKNMAYYIIILGINTCFLSQKEAKCMIVGRTYHFKDL